MAESTFQAKLQEEKDPIKIEWMCIQRRYHTKILSDHEVEGKTIKLFLSLSDPDLPNKFKEKEFEIVMKLSITYPMEVPEISVESNQDLLSLEQMEIVQKALQDRANQMKGILSIRKLLTWLDNNIGSLLFFPPKNDIPKEKVQVNEIKKKKTTTSRKKPCHFFLRGKCTNGDDCKFSHEQKKFTQKLIDQQITEEKQLTTTTDTTIFTRQKAETSKRNKNNLHSSTSTTDNGTSHRNNRGSTLRTICKFFAKNRCKQGESCKFVHEVEEIQAAAEGTIEIESDKTKEEKEEEEQQQTAIQPLLVNSTTITSATTPPTPITTLSSSSSEIWTEEQQKALDKALKMYPTSIEKKERWTKIAAKVEGKNLNECIDRFKYLCKLLRSTRTTNSTTVQAQVSTSPPSPPPPSSSSSSNSSSKTQTAGQSVTEEDETNPSLIDSRIILVQNRIDIETEPIVKGSRVRLEELFLHQVGTLITQKLVCHMRCTNCPRNFDVRLTLDTSKVQMWCPRCSVLNSIALRPVFAHSQSNIIAYVDCDNCKIVDILPSDLIGTCLDCGKEAFFENVITQRRSEQSCRFCHFKMALKIKRYSIEDIIQSVTSPASTHGIGTCSQVDIKKKNRETSEKIIPGQPLPKNGTCEHYKHSYRWFRFQCCGKAFPCDVCHDASDCTQANMGKIASRMICGLCSKEQSSSVKECSCGNQVGHKKITTSHWEGGTGCRTQLFMSQNDKKKFQGLHKTESKKFKRVGAEAKKRREAKKEAKT